MIGNRTRAKVVKNKIAPPFRQAEFDILFNEGISFVGDLVDLAIHAGVLHRSGTWFVFGGGRLGQGREKTVVILKGKPDLLKMLETETRKALGFPGPGGGDLGGVDASPPRTSAVVKKAAPGSAAGGTVLE